jgi:hypothetical protein
MILFGPIVIRGILDCNVRSQGSLSHDGQLCILSLFAIENKNGRTILGSGKPRVRRGMKFKELGQQIGVRDFARVKGDSNRFSV